MLGLCCCAGLPLVAASGGCSLVVLHWFLTAVTSAALALGCVGSVVAAPQL